MSSQQSSSSSSSMSIKNSQQTCLDPLDSLIDFSEYDTVTYQSPTLSPTGQKQQFVTRTVSNTPPTLPSSQPTLSGPSHNYDLYRQQTGIPKGAIANTLAINMSNNDLNQYGYDSYLSGLSPSEEFVDFGGKTEMDFDSPNNNEPAFFYPEQPVNEFIDPTAMTAAPQPGPAQSTSNVGRLWPGMHQQQAAMAKAQAQQKQQQQIIQQQRQASLSAPSKPQRTKGSHPPTDPIVEEKISQLLNSMRHSSVSTEDNDKNQMPLASRSRKDEDEMDEDERLLASEEGKKLSSKERRQLRNKVSARAFRSRRKEYIGQLEGEIAQKVNENQDLRVQNRALLEENTRLSDLTRMLLSSPSFSGFLDTLASNPAAAQTAQSVVLPQPQQPQQVEQPQRQIRKDINPYAAQQQMQSQHIGMTMIPEQSMDFSLLDLGQDGYFQPQVFSVLSLPETVIDVEVLSGKNTSITDLTSADEKVEVPAIDRTPASNPAKEVQTPSVRIVDDEFDADPQFVLYNSTEVEEPVKDLDINALVLALPFAKPTQYELNVFTAADDASSDAAVQRADRICDNLEGVIDRLSLLTVRL